MIDALEKEVDMLSRHLEVLRLVVEYEPIGIVRLSNETGYPHSKVRYSLRVLEEEGLVEPSSQGAITTGRTAAFLDDLDDQLDGFADRLEPIAGDGHSGSRDATGSAADRRSENIQGSDGDSERDGDRSNETRVFRPGDET